MNLQVNNIVLGGYQNEGDFVKIRGMSKNAQIRADGLENVLSRKGTSRSKTGNNTYTGLEYLDSTTIRDLYESGGIGAKVITRVADDITRKGFKIIGDTGDKIKKVFDNLDGTTTFNTAIRWARAYGGAIIVMTIDDGLLNTQELDRKRINKIERLEVYEAGCSKVVTVTEKYDDPDDIKYGKPKIYQINSMDGARFEIHESRCIRIDGRPLDSFGKSVNDGWGGSELQPVYESLLSMYSQLASGEEVLNEMVIGTLKIQDLDSLCIDSEGEELLRKRLDLVDMSKSNENSIAIDVNESYERHTVNLSGMNALQHNSMILVAGSADIPATFLYGSSPDGQNATGASDKEQYYGKIDAERQYLYKPALIRVLELISGKDIDIIFPSLQVSSLYDTARAFESTAKSLVSLVESGIITMSEGKKMLIDTALIEKISILE